MLSKKINKGETKYPVAKLFHQITRKFASIYPLNIAEKDYDRHFSIVQNNIEFVV
jgi:hypothetical protein